MNTSVVRANAEAGESRSAPVPWRLYDAIGVFVVWFVLMGFIGVGFAVVGLPFTDPLGVTLLLCTQALVQIVVTLLWVRLRSVEGPRRLVGLEPVSWHNVVAGLVYGLIGVVVITVVVEFLLQPLAEAFGFQIPEVQETLRQLVASPAAPLAVFVIVVLAPLAEELFFRGMLFQALEGRLRLWPAAVLSAAVFGAAHLPELLVVALTFLLGTYLAMIFRRRGTIVTPFVAHLVFNGVGVLLIRVGLG